MDASSPIPCMPLRRRQYDTSQGLPPPPPLLPMGAPYLHDGFCAGAQCERCYKYACPACGARSNRLYGPCWRCRS